MRFFFYSTVVVFACIKVMVFAWQDDRMSYMASIEQGYYSDGTPEAYYP